MQALPSHASSVDTARDTLSMMAQSVRQLSDLLKTNLGPDGTLKMLVNASGDIKLTKDGGVLIKEMQITHPITQFIAGLISSHDSMLGDGTTSLTLIISNIIIEAEKLANEGIQIIHIINGLQLGLQHAIKLLEKMKISIAFDRPHLVQVAKAALCTKVNEDMANSLAENCVDAIHSVFDMQSGKIDLHMIEKMTMIHKTANETTLVKGIVLDHGGRHPNMPKLVRNAFILTCNLSLEYEKTEVASLVTYSKAEEREDMSIGEREFILKRCHQIVALKESVCTSGQGFVVFNQGGIDPHSLDIFAKAGILALRRTKRRNMERLTLCCGGVAVNSTDHLKPGDLGYAGRISQTQIGEDNFTIVDECRNPRSVTMLVKGPNKYTTNQNLDAIKDGTNAVTSALVAKCVVPGAGAVELELARQLRHFAKEKLGASKSQLGVDVLAKAVECIPKSLAQNSGFDSQNLLLLNNARDFTSEIRPENMLGFNKEDGNLCKAVEKGIYDSFSIKINILQAAGMIINNFLNVDAVIKSSPEGMANKR